MQRGKFFIDSRQLHEATHQPRPTNQMTPEFKSLCEAFEVLASKLDARLARMEARMGLMAEPDATDGHPELLLEDEADTLKVAAETEF